MLLTSNAYNICQKKLPYQEISNKYKLARNLNLELGQLKDSLRHDLNFIEFIQITTVFLDSNNNIISKTKFFVPLLAPLTSNEYTIKDSFSFSKELLTFDSNLVLASFDIESLFTNISLKETIDLCVDILFSNTTNIDGITKDYFHELLIIYMSESLVLFHREFYKQIDGVAMGSPLGPTLANIFLCFHEQIWLDNCPVEFKPVIYRRFVDDTSIHKVKFK